MRRALTRQRAWMKKEIILTFMTLLYDVIIVSEIFFLEPNVSAMA